MAGMESLIPPFSDSSDFEQWQWHFEKIIMNQTRNPLPPDVRTEALTLLITPMPLGFQNW